MRRQLSCPLISRAPAGSPAPHMPRVSRAGWIAHPAHATCVARRAAGGCRVRRVIWRQAVRARGGRPGAAAGGAAGAFCLACGRLRACCLAHSTAYTCCSVCALRSRIQVHVSPAEASTKGLAAELAASGQAAGARVLCPVPELAGACPQQLRARSAGLGRVRALTGSAAPSMRSPCCRLLPAGCAIVAAHRLDGAANTGGLVEPPVVPRFLDALRAAGAQPVRVPAYLTSPGLPGPQWCAREAALLQEGHYDAVAFTSSAEVRWAGWHACACVCMRVCTHVRAVSPQTGLPSRMRLPPHVAGAGPAPACWQQRGARGSAAAQRHAARGTRTIHGSRCRCAAGVAGASGLTQLCFVSWPCGCTRRRTGQQQQRGCRGLAWSGDCRQRS